MNRTLALALSLASAASAQTSFPHAVLTELPTLAPRARVVLIDPTTGATTALAGFASDALEPLAMVRDPHDGDLVVALADGAGQSRIVRLHRPMSALTELPIATVPGRVHALGVARDEVFAAVDAQNGGIWRMPRRGGAATMALPLANLTAFEAWDPAPILLLAWTGRPGTAVPDSGVGYYDLSTAGWWLGPFSFQNPTGRTTTGVVELPTAVPRQLLSFDDGTFATFAGPAGQTLTPVTPSTPIPADGAVTVHPGELFSIKTWGLGGAGYPFLYDLDAFTGTLTVLSQPLPGAPIDFAPGDAFVAYSIPYGIDCGPTPPGQQWVNQAQLGTTFMVGVTTVPFGASLLIAGLDDIMGGALPLALPGGCPLHVAPDAVQFLPANQTGVAFFPIPIPATLSLIGTVLHTQWALYDGLGLQTSGAVAHRVGT